MVTTTPSPPTAAGSSNTSKITCIMEEENPLNTIHLLLGSKLRVTMTDGRVAHGNFVCLDRLGNIILDDVVECRRVAYIAPGLSEEGQEKNKLYEWNTERLLSQAVIPGNRLAKVEIAKTEWEERVG